MKLIRLLSSLTEKEVAKFEKYLRANHANKRSKLVELFAQIKRQYVGQSLTKEDKEAISVKVYPERPFKIKFLTDQMSKLVQELERFLVLQELKQNDYLFRRLKIDVFRERKLDQDFQEETHKLIRKQQELQQKDWSYYLECWRSYHLWYYQPLATPVQITSTELFVQSYQNFQQLTVMVRLQYACELLSKRITFKERELDFPFDVLLNEAAVFESQNKIIDYYCQLLVLYQGDSPNLTPLQNLMDLFQADHLLFGAVEKRSFFLQLINLVNREIEKGAESMTKFFFKLFRFGVEEEILIFHPEISPSTFLNVCTVGALNQEFEWTEDFVERYQLRLPSSSYESTLALAKAYIYLHRGQPGLAMQKISSYNFRNLYNKLRMYSLLSRCMFELHLQGEDYEDVLNSKLAAFTQFLNKEVFLSEKKMKSYQNLIKGIKTLIRLVRAKSDAKEVNFAHYKEALGNLKPVLAGKWLWSNYHKIARE